MKRPDRLALMALCFATLALYALAGAGEATEIPSTAESGEAEAETGGSWEDKVVVISVKGVIIGKPFSDLADQVKAALDRAEREEARLVVLEVDSPGGEVGTCDDLSRRVFECAVPVAALVVHKAVSGGAMVASAAKEIVMTRSARIGDIQPMRAGISGPEGEMDARSAEKIEVDIRTIMKVYAEGRHRPAAVFAAMVSRDVSLYQVAFTDGKTEYLDGHELKTAEDNIEKGRDRRKIASTRIIKPEGRLLELTAQQAVEFGVASEAVDSPEAFYAGRGIEEADMVRPGIVEGEFDLKRLIPGLDDIGMPVWILALLGVFLVAGIAGVITEYHVPGTGVPAAIGIIGFVCFFATLLMYGRGNPVGIAIFLVGIALLVVEIMVIPGFGVTGVLGILGILSGLLLAFTPDWNSEYMKTFMWEEIGAFTLLLLAALAATLVLIWVIAKYGSRLPFISFFTLNSSLPPGRSPGDGTMVGEDSAAVERLRARSPVGKTGKAETMLRPAGKVRLDSGELLDVVTDGSFVEPGSRVLVMEAVPGRIVVTGEKPPPTP